MGSSLINMFILWHTNGDIGLQAQLVLGMGVVSVIDCLAMKYGCWDASFYNGSREAVWAEK